LKKNKDKKKEQTLRERDEGGTETKRGCMSINVLDGYHVRSVQKGPAKSERRFPVELGEGTDLWKSLKKKETDTFSNKGMKKRKVLSTKGFKENNRGGEQKKAREKNARFEEGRNRAGEKKCSWWLTNEKSNRKNGDPARKVITLKQRSRLGGVDRRGTGMTMGREKRAAQT